LTSGDVAPLNVTNRDRTDKVTNNVTQIPPEVDDLRLLLPNAPTVQIVEATTPLHLEPTLCMVALRDETNPLPHQGQDMVPAAATDVTTDATTSVTMYDGENRANPRLNSRGTDQTNLLWWHQLSTM